MKILHVITGLQKAAGTSVFCVDLCDGLSRIGVETAIAVQHGDSDAYSPQENVPVFALSRGFEDLNFKPDLVHIHALWSPFLHQANAWARRSSLPVVYSPHGMLTPWALSQKPLKKWMALACYQYWDLRQANLLHATADSEVENIRRLCLKKPVIIAPLGVNMPSEGARMRRNNPRIALFVSRVHPQKGLLNLVDAWAMINPKGWKIVIAGPDQDGHSAEVMVRARAAGVEKDFEMIGPVFGKEKEELYAKADLFVLPTYSENFGVVVIEALAHGCPVITTKGAPWAELQGGPEGARIEKNSSLITHKSSFTASGRCGWWIDIGVEPLAAALREAMSLSDEERCAMGENGRRLVETKYTWPAIAEKMKSAYEWILNGGDKPDCVDVL